MTKGWYNIGTAAPIMGIRPPKHQQHLISDTFVKSTNIGKRMKPQKDDKKASRQQDLDDLDENEEVKLPS
jgi:hypothetical protein